MIDGPGMFGWFGHAFFLFASLLGTGLLLVVFIALAILLARFMLVATKAAQLYVDKNAPASIDTPATTAASNAATPTTPLPKRPKTP
jgi:hypothetical protein